MLQKFLEGFVWGALVVFVAILLIAVLVSALKDPLAMGMYGAFLLVGIIGGIINMVRS